MVTSEYTVPLNQPTFPLELCCVCDFGTNGAAACRRGDFHTKIHLNAPFLEKFASLVASSVTTPPADSSAVHLMLMLK